MCMYTHKEYTLGTFRPHCVIVSGAVLYSGDVVGIGVHRVWGFLYMWLYLWLCIGCSLWVKGYIVGYIGFIGFIGGYI